MGHGTYHDLYTILDFLPKNIQDKRILDAGFGCGEVTHIIVSFGNRKLFVSGVPYVIGIDIDPINVEFAKKYMPYFKEVYQYDIVNIPYPENIIKD